jgi:hypothetical protein
MAMVKISEQRSALARMLCVFSIALLCVMGSVQAAHAHPDDSTTSHHDCSICSAAHIGLSLPAVMTAPIVVAAPLATAVTKSAAISRPADTVLHSSSTCILIQRLQLVFPETR